MDPDATLARIRHLVESHNGGAHRDSEATENLAELVEHVEALDQWLSAGGHFPIAWVPSRLDRVAIQSERR